MSREGVDKKRNRKRKREERREKRKERRENERMRERGKGGKRRVRKPLSVEAVCT